MDKESKTLAIITYITIFGTLIALIINWRKRNSFVSFHIRQMVGLVFFLFVLEFINGIFPLGFVNIFFRSLLFVLWVIGLFRAINLSTKPIPIIGDFFQRWFVNL
ncbi:hypothetical protein [Aureivirga sp. CE67]|uniref:hypothetical protein n=1 Tax=Aureivirga sp. CE67 TaxID=1788983 RepID=UPI0018CB7434|nr:hypothetical protein [Aureivirga sp. CE67]